MARKLKIDNGGKVWAPYSPGITVRDHIWLAGQIGIEGGEDIVSQTSEALKKIDNLLEIANSSRDDLVMVTILLTCLLYTSPSPRDKRQSRMPSSA